MKNSEEDASFPNTLNDGWNMKEYQKDMAKFKTKINISLSQK